MEAGVSQKSVDDGDDKAQDKQTASILQLTSLAEMYNHPTGIHHGVDHSPLRGILPLKSGLTPVESHNSELEADTANNARLEAYQRKRYNS
jgi:hypothetical protein